MDITETMGWKPRFIKHCLSFSAYHVNSIEKEVSSKRLLNRFDYRCHQIVFYFFIHELVQSQRKSPYDFEKCDSFELWRKGVKKSIKAILHLIDINSQILKKGRQYFLSRWAL